MRTITKKYKIYNYEDILNNKELKEKILNKHYDINTNFDWYEFTLNEWTEKLEKLGFMNPKINFSGFWSQGDGASFTCDVIDIKLVAETSKLFKQREINALYALWNNGYIEANIERNTHHYYHSRTVTLNFYDGKMYTNWKHLQKIVDKLSDYLSDIIIDLSDEIYTDLENEYNYLTSELAILETIQANDYEFDENGDIV